MKIVAISDTHNRHNKVVIPPCDILIHAGDATGQGNISEVANFLKWFSKQPATFKIFLPGNHDCLFEDDYSTAKLLCNQYGITLLLDSEIIINGIKIYGSPVSPFFCNWAFNKIGYDIAPYWDSIPDDTNILVTHCPAMGTLDRINPNNYNGQKLGCAYLKNRLLYLKNLKYHIHGHIHGAYGSNLDTSTNLVSYNVAICNEDYEAVNKPVEIII